MATRRSTPDVNPSNIGEFELIRRFFSSGFPSSKDTRIAIGDDASLVQPPANCDLIQSIDTQVADVHFPAQAPAHLIAQRALRCAVSDLAAMGAAPQGFHLALTLPQANTHWLQDFSRGLKDAAHKLNIALLGGDTTQGKQLVISIAVQGWVPLDSQGQSQALTRSGAQPGDIVCLSGSIGSAALALDQVLANPADDSGLAQYYYFPQVHLQLGQALRQIASACIDISDGLLQDAEHIARASSVTLQLDRQCIQLADSKYAERCLTGGDDYQLLFTLKSPADLLQLQQQFADVYSIGKVSEQSTKSGVIITNGSPVISKGICGGFSHF